MANSLLRFLDFFSSYREAQVYASDAPILPTLDTHPIQPHALAPASAATPQPLKNWSHPFKDKNPPLLQLTQLAKAASGYYPLGRNGLWHGGVHFDSGTAGSLEQQSSVHCLADGEVVAYRIDEHSPTTSYFVNTLIVQKPFSRNFVLARHRLEAPKIEGSTDMPPCLTFYSLYMHLQDWTVYQRDPAIARPAFWPEGQSRRVKATVKDVLLGHPGQQGLNVRNQVQRGKVLALLPRGAEVTVSGEGEFRKLENSNGPDVLKSADGSLRGYLFFDKLEPIAGGEFRINATALNVREEANASSTIITTLPNGTEVTISGEGAFRKLERVNQYVHFNSLEGAREPMADRIVVLDQPIAIKAGELIGHIGKYQDSCAEHPEKKLHLEVFSGDEVETFIESSRDWAKRLPAISKTWLKIAKGTAVVAHQPAFNATQPPTLRDASTPSDADLLVPKSLLDGLLAENKIVVPATAERKACNWYRLDGLLHDASNTLLNGWVREEVGVTLWVNPWSWEGYDTIFNYDTPRQALASFLRAANRFSEDQLERHGALADASDKGPMKSRLYDIIDRDHDGKMTAEELQAAISLPAHAQSLSQLVIHYESEWHYKPKKWDALDEVLGHSGSTPHLNWLAEKERIKQMSWWDEVATKVGLPADGQVYHIHPVGLAGRFQASERRITVELLERVTGKSGNWFTGRGGGRAFVREFEEKYPRIYKYDKHRFVVELNDALERYEIITPYQQAHFIAQCFHESAAFETAVEFAAGTQYDPGRHSGAIVNGNTEIGDGPKYKGRGLIQLTWKNNYVAYSSYRGVDFVSVPNMLAENMFDAIDVSCWYWRHNGAVSRRHNAQGDINVLVDNEPGNVRLVTLAVNGGDNGLHERVEVYEAIRKEWGLA
jgi:predicted chitinase